MFSSGKLPILLLLLAPLLLYAPTLRFPFMWDDGSQIVNNEVLRDPSRALELVTSSTFDRGGGELTGAFYRPLASLSYLANYQLWGLNPTGFRIFQILLHALTGLLMFLVLKKLLSRSMDAESAKNLSLVTALFFEIHPAHVESVAYIASVGEIMFAIITLLGVALLFSAHSAASNSQVSHLRLFLFFCTAFIGLFAKETAIVIMPIAAWYLWLFVKPRLRTWLYFTVGSIATISLYLWIRLGIAQVPMLTSYPSTISQAPFAERLLTVPYVLFRYLVTLIAPYRLLIYQNDVVHSALDVRFWGSVLILASIAGLTLYFLKFKESKPEYFFLGWFLIGVAPVLNLLGLDMTIAERWLYVPSIGFLFFIALVLRRIAQRVRPFAAKLPYVLIAVFILFSVRTLVRAHDWRSEAALYAHDIRFVKDSFELMNNHALQLIEARQYDEAQALLERALALDPSWFRAYINLGNVYQLQGKTEQAIDMYLEAIQRFNVNFGYANLARLLITEKRYDEARDVLALGRHLFPTFKRLTFLEIIVEHETGNKEEALARLQDLLKQNVLDRDIQEFITLLDQFNIPRNSLMPGN